MTASHLRAIGFPRQMNYGPAVRPICGEIFQSPWMSAVFGTFNRLESIECTIHLQWEEDDFELDSTRSMISCVSGLAKMIEFTESADLSRDVLDG